MPHSFPLTANVTAGTVTVEPRSLGDLTALLHWYAKRAVEFSDRGGVLGIDERVYGIDDLTRLREIIEEIEARAGITGRRHA